MQHPKHANAINKYFKKGLYGAGWYDETRHHIEEKIGSEHTPIYIDFLAATSPNQSVAGNVTCANKALRQFRDGKAFTGYLPIVKNMLDTIRINHMTGHRAPFGGLKVQNFADALAGDLSAVVVDRWILRAFGYPLSATPKRYRLISEWITAKAQREGMEPAQVQAAIWCGIKDLEDETGFKTAPFEAYL